MRDWDELLSEVAEMQPPGDVARYVSERMAVAARSAAGAGSRGLRRGRLMLRLVAVGIGVVVVIAALALAAHSHRSNAPAPASPETTRRVLTDAALLDAQFGPGGGFLPQATVPPGRRSDGFATLDGVSYYWPLPGLFVRYTNPESYRAQTLRGLRSMSNRAEADLRALGAPPPPSGANPRLPRSTPVVRALAADVIALRIAIAQTSSQAHRPSSETFATLRRWTSVAHMSLLSAIHDHPVPGMEQPPTGILQRAVADGEHTGLLVHGWLRHPSTSPVTTGQFQMMAGRLRSDEFLIQGWRTLFLGQKRAAYGTALQTAIGVYSNALRPRKDFTPHPNRSYRSYVRDSANYGDLYLGMWLRDNPALLHRSALTPASAIAAELSVSHITLTRYSTNYAKIGREGATQTASHQLGTSVLAAVHEHCTVPGHAPTDCWVLTLTPKRPPASSGPILDYRTGANPEVIVELALVDVHTGRILYAVRG